MSDDEPNGRISVSRDALRAELAQMELRLVEKLATKAEVGDLVARVGVLETHGSPHVQEVALKVAANSERIAILDKNLQSAVVEWDKNLAIERDRKDRSSAFFTRGEKLAALLISAAVVLVQVLAATGALS